MLYPTSKCAGSIVTIASVVGVRPKAGIGAHCASQTPAALYLVSPTAWLVTSVALSVDGARSV